MRRSSSWPAKEARRSRRSTMGWRWQRRPPSWCWSRETAQMKTMEIQGDLDGPVILRGSLLLPSGGDLRRKRSLERALCGRLVLADAVHAGAAERAARPNLEPRGFHHASD